MHLAMHRFYANVHVVSERVYCSVKLTKQESKAAKGRLHYF